MLWAVFIIALVVIVFLLAVEQYYVAVALVAGTIIMRHRELWSLITRRKLPPVDERVRENTGKAIRNGFVYFAAATALLMLPFTEIVTDNLDTTQVLGALFLSAGLVYLLSYIFYDRAESKMNRRRLNLLKAFLLVIGIAVGVFIIGAFLHNMFYAIFSIGEPVFFVIAVMLAPAAIAIGIVGSLVMFFLGLAGKPSGTDDNR
jgi:MFS family permease